MIGSLGLLLWLQPNFAYSRQNCNPDTRADCAGSGRPINLMPIDNSNCKTLPGAVALFTDPFESPINFAIVDSSIPHWDPVTSNSDHIAVTGTVRISEVSHEDYAPDHDSHDWTFFVKLDRDRYYLNTESNIILQGEHDRLMQMEWETKFFPKEFWPKAGDKVWMMGRYVFDCGHFPYRTEIHPPEIVAFTRTEPVLFSVAGIPDTVPSMASKTFIYAHGRGGYYSTNIGGRDYEFDISVPPKPSNDAKLHTEVLNLPFGGPAPTLTPIPDNTNPYKIHIKYPLANIAPSSYNKFGAIVAAGWREPVLTQGYKQFAVTFDSIKINRPGDWKLAAAVNGNWVNLLGNELADAKSAVTVSPEQDIKLGQKVMVTVPDNGELNIMTSGWILGSADNYLGASPGFLTQVISRFHVLSQGQPIGIITDSRYNTGKVFNSASNFGVGSHDDVSVENPDIIKESEDGYGNPQRIADYNLRYHIEEVGSFPKGQPNPSPKIATITPISIKIVDSNGLSRSTRIQYTICAGSTYAGSSISICHGTHSSFSYPPELDGSFDVTTGSTINIPSDAIIHTNPTKEFAVRFSVKDYGLPYICFPPRLCHIDPDAPISTRVQGMSLVSTYNEANNFGEGMHTERSPTIGSGGSGGLPGRTHINEYLEATYRIDVSDYNPP